MNEQQFTSVIEAWLRDTDPIPPEPMSRVEAVMGRVSDTRRLGRHWPPERLVRELEPVHPGPRGQGVSAVMQRRTETGGLTPMSGAARLTIGLLVLVAVMIGGNLVLRGGRPTEEPSGLAAPGAADSTTAPAAGIVWDAGSIRFEAAALRLDLGDKVITGEGPATVDGYAYQPGHRELDVSWQEQGAGQYLSVAVDADESHWWISRLTTEDGTPDGNMIEFGGPELEALSRTPLGSMLETDLRLEGTPDIDSEVDGPVSLEIDGLRLAAFEPGTGAERVAVQVGDITVTGDTVGNGMLKVIDDGTSHELETVIDVAVTPDGRAWAATPTRIYQLGAEGGLRAVEGGPRLIGSLEAGANGHLLVPDYDVGGWLTSDGRTWSSELERESAALGEASLAADGSMWGSVAEGGGIGRLDANGFTAFPPGEVFPAASAADPGLDESSIVTTLPDGVVWAATRFGGSVSRFDGTSWAEYMPLGDPKSGVSERVLDLVAGADGTIWVLLQDSDGRHLGRFDGTEWSLHSWSDVMRGLPGVIGDDAARTAVEPEDLGAVAADGSIILGLPSEGGSRNAAIIRFDGETTSATRLDETMAEDVDYLEFMAASPSGHIWTAGHHGLYLLDPDAWQPLDPGS